MLLADLEPTSPTLRLIGQACFAVTQKVGEAIRSKQDEDAFITDRKYADGDEDLDREKLAKEVMPQIEKEKQKVIKAQSPVDNERKSMCDPQKEGDNPTKRQNNNGNSL